MIQGVVVPLFTTGQHTEHTMLFSDSLFSPWPLKVRVADEGQRLETQMFERAGFREIALNSLPKITPARRHHASSHQKLN